MADEKNDMEHGETGRSELERYRSGQMNEAERHALEKKALSDPFLAEALDGAEQIPAEIFSKDVDELSGKLASTKSGNWFTPLRIAAGVLILLASGSLIYYFNTSRPEQLAMKSTEGPAATDSSAVKKDSSSALLSLAKPDEPATNATSPVQQPRTSSQERAEPAAGPPAGVAGELKKPAETLETRTDIDLDKTDIAEHQAEEAKKEALHETEKTLAAPRAEAQGASRAKENYLVSPRKIAGRVISSNDSSPLPGVNVVVMGTNQGAVTDSEGNFQISTKTNNPRLVITSIGMETKEVSPADQGVLEVRMNADNRQRSEVAVSGSGVSTKDDMTDRLSAFEFAAPSGGRSAFQKYLETNIRYPAQAIANKTEGKVTVQFTVTASGSLTNFSIIKGIGNGCDEELIRLIQNGPGWTPSRRNQVPIEDQVRVRLRFSLPR